MDKLKKPIAIALIAVSLWSVNAMDQRADAHWADDNLEWAKQMKIIKGYPDGTIRPDNEVTEAEFLTMYTNAFNPKALISVEYPEHWSDAVYNYAAQQNYPTVGFRDIDKRNVPINRTKVAEIVAGSTGVNYTGNNAIHYLLAQGLANGKVPGEVSVAAYKGNDLLTRAEAVTFIRNVMSKGLRELKDRPFTPSDVSQLPPLPKAETPNANDNDPVEKDGRIKVDYSKAINKQVVDSFDFSNGKFAFSLPELPEGFTYRLALGLDYKDGTWEYLNYNREFVPGKSYSIPVDWSKVKKGSFSVGVDNIKTNSTRVITVVSYPSMEVRTDVGY
ncbi:S-layer homology domain-containing protein [Ammoniphilus resinae]|uniref:SLH domain-containing protein n=1 Tax=Ammoniphilus resinae TaxID=861532 RepID=A0ABS4GNN9_9BACL|nr:S-layer homology domain-containing protein [Ammoniphilus resinae]MBP1931890.1 hypothetical protein [Ammoniphilus resinae]